METLQMELTASDVEIDGAFLNNPRFSSDIFLRIGTSFQQTFSGADPRHGCAQNVDVRATNRKRNRLV